MAKVAIIIPVFKANADWLNETITSIHKQTYNEYKIYLVSDNCPNFSEKMVLKNLINEKVEIVRNEENLKAAGVRNKKIFSLGEEFKYICFIDQDDTWHADKLKLQVEAFDKETVCIHTNINIIDEQSNLVKGAANNENHYRNKMFKNSMESKTLKLFERNSIRLSSSMVDSAKFKEIGGFDTALFGGEDWDFWVRLSACGYIKHIKSALTNRRVHSENVSITASKTRVVSFGDAVNKYRNNDDIPQRDFDKKINEIYMRLAVILYKERDIAALKKELQKVKVLSFFNLKYYLMFIYLKMSVFFLAVK